MWEIYAYHNSDALAGIFNAIAAIVGSGSFAGTIAAVAVCGFIAAMIAYMFAPEKLQGWKWIGGVVLIYGILIVPRAQVAIVDKTGGSAVRVVDNVPFGAAALGGLTSTVGHVLTDLFETAFQTIPGPGALPAELAYQQNGMMFGSRLIQATRQVGFSDPYHRTDLLNFIENCTVYDLEDRSISPADFVKADNIWELMASTNPARFTTVSDASGVVTKPCDEAYVILDMRMPAQINNLLDILAGKVHPTLANAAAKAALLDSIPQAYIRSLTTTAASGATDILRQNALINAINDSAELRCQRIDSPSCMMMATGRSTAVASQNAAWINGAKISEQALPIVRNAAEALTYAVFPIVVLLLFLTSGRSTIVVLSGYLAVLISIQLWPPLFAVLNYMASIYTQFDQAAASDIGGGLKSLSLSTANGIYGTAISAQAVVSYLIIAIPPLSYALANRLVNFGATLTGGLTGLQSTIGNTSSGAATGNISMGNVSMDQRNVSPMTSSPFVRKEQDMFGNWHTHDGAGRTAISFLRNEGIASLQVSGKVTAADVESANKAVSAAKSETISASQSQAAVLSQIFTKGRSDSSLNQHGISQSFSSTEETARAFEQMGSQVQRISQATGVSQSQVAGTLLKFQMMPDFFGMGGGAGVSKTNSAALTDEERKIKDAANSETYKAVSGYSDQVKKDNSFLSSLASQSQTGRSLVSALQSSTAQIHAADRKYQEAVTRAEEFRRAHEVGIEARYDITADPMNVERLSATQEAVSRFGGNPQAIASYYSSMMGNISLSPSRVTGGTALPNSFGDVRSVFEAQARDRAVGSSVSSAKAANDRSVGGGRSVNTEQTGPFYSDPSPLPSDVISGSRPSRSELHRGAVDKGAAITGQNGAAIGQFESKNGVITDSTGNIRSERSLVQKSMRATSQDIVDVPKAVLNSGREILQEQKERFEKNAGNGMTASELMEMQRSGKPLDRGGSSR
ncbi:conjugal transfer protein TraG N-terminal domain-containing protein [Azohydromonas lata]|uniref:Conjugal transfer protein TraG N-terminal domain-containing protein n=1 Tax=Azohydromonas lata TaxID=45677 RepID=A0ABU5I7G0_9BURK|nr:conjugal transfer protein TraG N-terminal domain-containing protein [Azohydromonas lata]MDZ5455041.1 conjugal transfer protein TraG N-terminal domain-containing protein [Azohydromonas lata]